jgi:hypothetical protein
VTSPSAAELTSVTTVVGVRSTVAAVLSRWVSWIVLPDTDLTMPSTWSLPMGGGGLGAEVVGLADGLGFPVLGLLVVLQAATDNAVAATIVPIASRIGMGPSRVADINFLRLRVLPVPECTPRFVPQ